MMIQSRLIYLLLAFRTVDSWAPSTPFLTLRETTAPKKSELFVATALDLKDFATTTTDNKTPSKLTLYCKAGVCPFSHAIRMVLEELNIEYDLQLLTSSNAKPQWLQDQHGGRLPALKHETEEDDDDAPSNNTPGTSVILTQGQNILNYLLETFDTDQKLSKEKPTSPQDLTPKEIQNLFPALSRYIKYSWFDKGHDIHRESLRLRLDQLEAYLQEQRTKHGGACYWYGDDNSVSWILNWHRPWTIYKRV